MFNNESHSQKILESLVGCLFAKRPVPEKTPVQFERVQKGPEPATLPPRNNERKMFDSERGYRYRGVDGWKFQGYEPNGNMVLTTDLYKQVSLLELRSLNYELNMGEEPRIGNYYVIRRSSGAFEKFLYQGINPATQKLMMLKPKGHTVSVSEADLAQENWNWNQPWQMMSAG